MIEMAKVGLLIDQHAAATKWNRGDNVIEIFTTEVLSHAGIPFQLLSSAAEAHLYDIIVIALEPGTHNPTALEHLWSFAQNGGILISFAGMNSFLEKLNYKSSPDIGPGYARLPAQWGASEFIRFLQASVCHRGPDPASDENKQPAGFEAFGEVRHTPFDAGCIGSALTSITIGDGALHRWAIHLPSTWVGLQQGTKPVTEDGIPAPDGTASINDQLLKADDSFEMDWSLDRVNTSTGSTFFPLPYSDLWKEVFLHHLLTTAQKLGKSLPFVSYWPDGIEQVGLISHDSDRNCDDSARTTLAILREYHIQATWCLIKPGYSPDIYPLLLQDGHEIGLHYNAMEDQNGGWGEQEFTRQLTWFKQATQQEHCFSNKNHYTRFQGWGQLFQWCEQQGILVDQTKGPSKKGNVGFLFGTCHPYYPIADAAEHNRPYSVLELGFLTQDHLDHSLLEDSEVLHTFLSQVKRVKGLAHFTFHPIHIHNRPHVNEAFRKVLKTAQDYELTFMTSKAIADWERFRRSLSITGLNCAGEAVVSLDASPLLGHPSNAVIWVPIVQAPGEAVEHTEVRFGVLCKKQIITI